MYSLNSNWCPTGAFSSGMINPGQTLEFSTTLPYHNYYTPYGIFRPALDISDYFFNYANTNNDDSSPVINGVNIPLKLWGSETGSEAQYINLIGSSSGSYERQTCQYSKDNQIFTVELDCGGYNQDMEHIYFTINLPSK